jgi:hypothetical protein
VPNLIGGEEVRTGRWMPVVTPHAHAVALARARADRLVLKGGSTDDKIGTVWSSIRFLSPRSVKHREG